MEAMVAVYATLSVGISTALIILARRYKNLHSFAGENIAGWGVFIILIIWLSVAFGS